jgi:cytoskeletal protein CcmA (bactofilin family)
MALQQINWIQIDTENIPSGSSVTLASPEYPFEAIYAKNFGISGSLSLSGSIDTTGDVIIGGNLTVKGSTTSIESNVVSIGDNIIELNGSLGSFGGLLINDPTEPNKISGSLLWDTTNDKWIGGPLGSEEAFIQETQFNNFSSSISTAIGDSGIWQPTGSFYATSNDLQVTGSMVVRGDLRVEGTTTLVQTVDNNTESLIVSGAMSIVRNEINSQIASASLTIQNLGTLADRNSSAILDCGDGFF